MSTKIMTIIFCDGCWWLCKDNKKMWNYSFLSDALCDLVCISFTLQDHPPVLKCVAIGSTVPHNFLYGTTVDDIGLSDEELVTRWHKFIVSIQKEIDDFVTDEINIIVNKLIYIKKLLSTEELYSIYTSKRTEMCLKDRVFLFYNLVKNHRYYYIIAMERASGIRHEHSLG